MATTTTYEKNDRDVDDDAQDNATESNRPI
jgi:hypothetical protein